MAELTNRDDLTKKLHSTTDAMVWAETFVTLHGGDVSLMLSWFANAIEVGREAGRVQEPWPEETNADA